MIKEYVPTALSTSKMVDFCVVFQASEDEDDTNPDRGVGSAVDSFRADLPFESINHTSLPALGRKPIAISIETKRSGGDESKGTLQIGSWQAAQWVMFEKHRVDLRTASDIFLPAVLISGHLWYFVATTRDGTKTVSSPGSLSYLD